MHVYLEHRKEYVGKVIFGDLWPDFVLFLSKLFRVIRVVGKNATCIWSENIIQHYSIFNLILCLCKDSLRTCVDT